jgi:hypothetical protein
MATSAYFVLLLGLVISQIECGSQSEDFKPQAQAEPNPPIWPDSVTVFGPGDSTTDIKKVVDAAYAKNGGQTPPDHGQWSEKRYAFFFKPGNYTVEVPVGFYTTVHGLGTSPTDVVFTSSKGVYCEEGDYTFSIGALNSFWRGAENFQTDADFAWDMDGHKGMLWATSQATSLRRIVVTNDLNLYQYRSGDPAAGLASGGNLANSEIKGAVASGSQQQFLSRNNRIGKWLNAVWNIVSVGTQNAPSSHCGADPPNGLQPFTTVDTTPVIAEKPFISIGESDKYMLNIPQVSRNRKGTDFSASQVGFEQVYVANPSNTASEINSKLKQGLHVVLAPGIYNLDASLELNHDNQVLLGLGLATLVAMNGTPAVTVGNVDGVRIAGVLLEAGPKLSQSLLQWGDPTTKYACKASNPGVGNDIFARVGGPSKPSPVQAKTMLHVSSGNVIIDNSWLWRADHSRAGIIKNRSNPVDVGIQIDGDDVVLYGAKTEHALTDQLQWNGNRGKTFMFQSELPYDVTQADFGDKGYTGYRVSSTVTEHEAYGIGVYHYFRDYAVTVKAAIVSPAHLESSFVAPLAVFLNGLGTVEHILNDKGNATKKASTPGAVAQWLCPAPSPSKSLAKRVLV